MSHKFTSVAGFSKHQVLLTTEQEEKPMHSEPAFPWTNYGQFQNENLYNLTFYDEQTSKNHRDGKVCGFNKL